MSDTWKAATGQTIDKIMAWVAIEPDGGEGIMAFQPKPGLWMPMIGADTARIESMRQLALHVAKVAGLPCKLVEYSVRREIEHHDPL